MIKICYVILTLFNSGGEAMVNFNEVAAVTREDQLVGGSVTKVYFTNASVVGANTLSIKEDVSEIAEKVKKCETVRPIDNFIFIGD